MTLNGQPFTPEEDMAIWRFAMEDHREYGNRNMWDLFVNTGGSKRPSWAVRRRFDEYLVVHLPDTKFHTETKLNICYWYKVPVDAEFLKALEEDANVTRNHDLLITWYTMKPTAGPNLDKQMSDEDFLKITSSIMKKFKKIYYFTIAEDDEIWKFAAENHDQYYGKSTAFWEMMVRKLNWQRTGTSVAARFKTIRFQLHHNDIDLEIKLMLFKKFKIPINLNYLKLLENLYEVKIDDERCVCWYQKKTVQQSDQADQVDQAEKRKCPSEDTDGVTKKSRLSETVVEDPAPRVLSLQETTDSATSADDVAQKDSSQGPPQLEMEQLEYDEESSRDPLEDVTLQNSTILDSVSEQEPEESPVLEKECVPAMDTTAEQMRREMTKMMEKVSEKMVHFDQKMTEMSKTQEESIGSVKNEISGVMQNVSENKIHFDQEITKMSKTLKESMKNEISEVAKTVTVLTDGVKAIRQQIQVESAEKKVPNRKEYLQKLKNFVSSINAPDMEDVLQKIDTAIQNSPDDDVDPIPTRVIRGSLDMTLLLIGQ